MLVEMLHSLLSHAGELHMTGLPFRAAVGATSTTFAYVQRRGDFLLWIIWELFQSLLGHKKTWLFHLDSLQMLEPLSLHLGVDGQQQAEAAMWDWNFCVWKSRGEDEEVVILESEGCTTTSGCCSGGAA